MRIRWFAELRGRHAGHVDCGSTKSGPRYRVILQLRPHYYGGTDATLVSRDPEGARTEAAGIVKLYLQMQIERYEAALAKE